jgi:hypothetical protein
MSANQSPAWTRYAVTGAIMAAAALLAPSSATATPVDHQCGASIGSDVKTETTLFNTQSKNFVNVPGASVTVTVPSGQTRCVKVRFSVEGRCSLTGSTDACFIRVNATGAGLLDPAVNGIQFISEKDNNAAYSFQWVKALTAGTYTIKVEAAVQHAATNFTLAAWTLDVETTQ